MSDFSLWNVTIEREVPGSVDGILTYFPVAIRILYNSNINTDFSDVRFSLDDDVTELSYYIVDKVDQDYADFLVKIPSIPSAPDSINIHIHTGNPQATISTSDPNSVYILYDDFNGSTLDLTKWILDSGTVTLADSIATLENDQNNWLGISSIINYIDKCSVEMRIKNNSLNMMVGLAGQHSTMTGDVIVLLWYLGYNVLTCIQDVCNDDIVLPDLSDDFHDVKMNVSPEIPNVETFVDNISKGVSTVDIPIGPYQFMATQLSYGGIINLDYVKISKFTENPPVVEDVGYEFFVPGFEITDDSDNQILQLLFETMYSNSIIKKVVKIKSYDYTLNGIIINTIDTDPSLIPPPMQNPSVGSAQYMQLSLDDETYSDTLYIDSIEPHTSQEIYVKCQSPQVVYASGPFICDLKVDLESC